MYGLNAVALVFFGCINVLAYRVSKLDAVKRRTVVVTVCMLLLTGNVFRYCVLSPLILGEVIIPVEFSAVAYFVVPLILLTTKRALHSWAAYSGLMAGFFYYMAMILAGGPIYESYPPLDIFVSMFCHGSLYFCGFVTIAAELCSEKDVPKLILGVVLVAVNALVWRPFVDNSSGLLIYILLDAAAVKALLPQSVWGIALPVYYLAVAVLVRLSIHGFFRRNQKQYRKFSAVSV